MRRLRHSARPARSARAAIGHFRRPRPQDPEQPTSLPAPIPACGPAARLAGSPQRVAGLGLIAGPQLADRGPARSLHHARPRLGRAGAAARVRRQGLLRLVRCADHLHCRDEGMVGRASVGARLAKLVVAGIGRAVRAVPRQGQRAVSHGQLSRHPARQRRTLEDGGCDQGLSLADVCRGKVLYEPAAGRFHGRGPRCPPRGSLALVADRQCAGKRRCRFRLPAVRGRCRQGPRRRVRQSSDPHDKLCLPSLRRTHSRRRGARIGGASSGA